MKKVHIVLLLIVAASVAAILASVSDSSTYADFATAQSNIGAEYHIVGKLDKNKSQEYQPQVNANLFSFYLKDNKGVSKQVLYNGSKPQDFEKSEQIVVVGKITEAQQFIASSILMKCPSKYNNPQDGKNIVAN